jgi:hypothetical protein
MQSSGHQIDICNRCEDQQTKDGWGFTVYSSGEAVQYFRCWRHVGPFLQSMAPNAQQPELLTTQSTPAA